MSGDYYAHVDRKYDEILARLEALEKKVGQSKLMMRRHPEACLLYTSPSPRDLSTSRMPSSA